MFHVDHICFRWIIYVSRGSLHFTDFLKIEHSQQKMDECDFSPFIFLFWSTLSFREAFCLKC